MRYRCIFFDLDGTLTDSGEGIMNSGEYAFLQMGLPVPARSALRKMVGPPLSVSFPMLGVPQTLVDEAIRLYRLRYNEGGGKFENRVYDGIEACLMRLKDAGCKLFVATSKPEQLAREILEGFGLAPYFEYIAGASWDKSRETKDDVLRYLISVIGEPDGAVMIGDTQYDVTGAHLRGLPCIGVTWGYGTRDELAAADAVVDSPEALLARLLPQHASKQENHYI